MLSSVQKSNLINFDNECSDPKNKLIEGFDTKNIVSDSESFLSKIYELTAFFKN